MAVGFMMAWSRRSGLRFGMSLHQLAGPKPGPFLFAVQQRSLFSFHIKDLGVDTTGSLAGELLRNSWSSITHQPGEGPEHKAVVIGIGACVKSNTANIL